MTSIRKTKKSLKREIRRIDSAIIELAKHDGLESAMWDLFLWRNYFERKIKAFGCRWTGECIKPIATQMPSNIEQLITLINNGKYNQ